MEAGRIARSGVSSKGEQTKPLKPLAAAGLPPFQSSVEDERDMFDLINNMEYDDSWVTYKPPPPPTEPTETPAPVYGTSPDDHGKKAVTAGQSAKAVDLFERAATPIGTVERAEAADPRVIKKKLEEKEAREAKELQVQVAQAVEHRLVLREPGVGVQRVVVHRDHAEQVVVGLGDCLAGPVLVDVANDKIFEVSSKGPFVCGHDVKSRCRVTSVINNASHKQRSRKQRQASSRGGCCGCSPVSS